MSFQGDIVKFTDKTEKRLEQIRRGTILKLFTAVSKDTPVDKGMLRGNWQTSVSKPKDGEIERLDPDGSAVKAEISNNLGKYGQPVHFTNNLPYAKVAEYGLWGTGSFSKKVTSKGFSRKATKGMMRKNAIRFQRLLADEAKRTKSAPKLEK